MMQRSRRPIPVAPLRSDGMIAAELAVLATYSPHSVPLAKALAA